MIQPCNNMVHVKIEKEEKESNGILLDNVVESIMSRGIVQQDVKIYTSNRNGESLDILFNKGDVVYYQKSKAFDTHIKDEQIVKSEDIIYKDI